MPLNMGSLGSLFIDLAANTAKFETDIGRASRLADKQAKDIQRAISSGVDASVAKLAALGAAYITLDATIGRLKAAIDQGDKLDEMAQKIGASVTALSHINYAAAHEGVDDITGSLVKLNKAILESKNPLSDQAKAFKALDITTTDAAGNLRATDEVFSDIVRRFGETKDGIQKTNIALALFGKSGADLIPLLNSGEDGFKRLADQSDALGVTWTSTSAALSGQLNDNLWEMNRAVDGLFIKLAQQLTPHIAEFTAKIADPQFQDAIGRWTSGVIEVAGVLVEKLPRILQLFAAIKGAQAGVAVGSFFGPVGSVVGALAGAGIGGSAAEALTDRLGDMGDHFKTAAEKAEEVRIQITTLGAEYSRLQNRIKDGSSYREGGTAGLEADARTSEAILRRMQSLSAQSGAPQGSASSARAVFDSSFGTPDAKPFAFSGSFDPAAIQADAMRELEQQIQREGVLLEQAGAQWQDYYDTQLEGERRMEETRARIAKNQADYIEGTAEQQRAYGEFMQQQQFANIDIAQQGLAVLQMVQGQSKQFQIGMLIAQNALAAASIFANTQIASAQALAMYGPAGPAAAAAIEARGAISLALVGAATAVGIAQISGSRRYGGAVQAGGMYEVAEPGNPELLRYGNKTMLLMGQQSGVVEPAVRASDAANSIRSGMGNLRVTSDLGFPVQAVPFVTGDELQLRLRYTESAAVTSSQRALARDQELGGPLTRQRRAMEGSANRPLRR